MSDERTEGEERPAEAPPRGPRRESPLLARSPVFAMLAAALAGWLLWGLWPDVAFFFSSRDPIDLGAPGAYHLDAARENRLVHVQGKLVDTVQITEGKSGAARTVGRVAGTNLLVDRPGPASAIDLYEGRLLPLDRRGAYDEVAATIRKRGTALGDRWQVLRDGERPRRGWLPVLGGTLLVLILAVNLRALLRPILGAKESR